MFNLYITRYSFPENTHSPNVFHSILTMERKFYTFAYFQTSQQNIYMYKDGALKRQKTGQKENFHAPTLPQYKNCFSKRNQDKKWAV